MEAQAINKIIKQIDQTERKANHILRKLKAINRKKQRDTMQS